MMVRLAIDYPMDADSYWNTEIRSKALRLIFAVKRSDEEILRDRIFKYISGKAKKIEVTFPEIRTERVINSAMSGVGIYFMYLPSVMRAEAIAQDYETACKKSRNLRRKENSIYWETLSKSKPFFKHMKFRKHAKLAEDKVFIYQNYDAVHTLFRYTEAIKLRHVNRLLHFLARWVDHRYLVEKTRSGIAEALSHVVDECGDSWDDLAFGLGLELKPIESLRSRIYCEDFPSHETEKYRAVNENE